MPPCYSSSTVTSATRRFAKWAENEIHGTFEPFRIQLSSVAENVFVPILYQMPAFEAFDDFSDFLESASCVTSKSCQVHVVRIHAGEPTFWFNDLEAQWAFIVQILYLAVAWTHRTY
jgi:hypothetical protein